MGAQAYASLLEEVGQKLGIPLQPNENNTCYIAFPNGVGIQMEVHEDEKHFLIMADLGSIPAGKYRENVFCEALKANGMPLPRVGRFAFSKNDETLVLFDMLPFKELTGDKIWDHLTPFAEKALLWEQAIKNGELPRIDAEAQSASKSQAHGLFDLGL